MFLSKTRESGFGIIAIIMMFSLIGIGGYYGSGPVMEKYQDVITKTRDSRRMHELRNMATLISAESTLKGSSPKTEKLAAFLHDASPKIWADTETGKPNCYDGKYTTEKSDYKKFLCRYQYAQCDGGQGFVIRTRVENPENIILYTKDDLAGKTGSPDHYDMGTCKKYPQENAFIVIE